MVVTGGNCNGGTRFAIACRLYSFYKPRNRRDGHEEAGAANHTDCWIEPRDFLGGRRHVRRRRPRRNGDGGGPPDAPSRPPRAAVALRGGGRGPPVGRGHTPGGHRGGG